MIQGLIKPPKVKFWRLLQALIESGAKGQTLKTSWQIHAIHAVVEHGTEVQAQ